MPCQPAAYTYGVKTDSLKKARSCNHGRSPKQPRSDHHIVSMPVMVWNIFEQQRGGQDAALGVPLSDDSNYGSVNLDHHLFRPIFQSMGSAEICVQYILGILFAVDRAARPGQIFGECVQPRQHLESACLVCSYCEGYNALLYGVAVKNHTERKTDLEGVP